MERGIRTRTAWLSYLAIQAAWLLLIFLMPLAFDAHPSRYWSIPFCCITVAGGLHLTYFRHEYAALLRKILGLFPPARYVMPSLKNPRYLLPLGVAYMLFGVTSALTVILA